MTKAELIGKKGAVFGSWGRNTILEMAQAVQEAVGIQGLYSVMRPHDAHLGDECRILLSGPSANYADIVAAQLVTYCSVVEAFNLRSSCRFGEKPFLHCQKPANRVDSVLIHFAIMPNPEPSRRKGFLGEEVSGAAAFLTSGASESEARRGPTEVPPEVIALHSQGNAAGFAALASALHWQDLDEGSIALLAKLALGLGLLELARKIINSVGKSTQETESIRALIERPRVLSRTPATGTDFKVDSDSARRASAHGPGKWLAVRSGEVIAEARSLRELKVAVGGDFDGKTVAFKVPFSDEQAL